MLLYKLILVVNFCLGCRVLGQLDTTMEPTTNSSLSSIPTVATVIPQPEENPSLSPLPTVTTSPKYNEDMIKIANSVLQFKIDTIEKALTQKNNSPMNNFALEFLKSKLIAAKQQQTLMAKTEALMEYQTIIELYGLKSLISDNSNDEDSTEDNIYDIFNDLLDGILDISDDDDNDNYFDLVDGILDFSR